MKISISESAVNDLESIRDYYKDEGIPKIGIDFVVSIVGHIETLLDNPKIGRMVPEFGEEKIRELIHQPFRIVHLKESSSIHVIRVWRSERLLVLPNSET